MRYAVALVVVLAFGQEQADVEALIRKLGATDLAEREAASKALVARGQAVRPALERAARGEDKGVAALSRAILDQLDRHIDGLCAALERIRTEAGPSYQRYLRNATQLFRELTDGKGVDRIRESLERQGLVRKASRWGKWEYVAREKAYVSSSGISHDLVLHYSSVPRVSDTEPTHWDISDPTVHLVARPRVEFADLVGKAYPAESVLQLALEHETSRETAAQYAILTDVELFYGDWLLNVRELCCCKGFKVLLSFANRENTAGASVNLFYESGLDPSEGTAAADSLILRDSQKSGGWSKSYKPSYRLRRGDVDHSSPSPTKLAEVYGAGDLKSLPEDIHDIRIEGGSFRDSACERLLRFKWLRSLEWNDEGYIPNDAYAYLGKLTSLEALDVCSHAEVGDDCLAQLSGLVRLKQFDLSSAAHVTDKGAAVLAGLPELTNVELHWSGNLSDESLKRFGEHKKLESLHLWGSKSVTDAGVEALAKSGTLRALTLGINENLTAAGLAHLEKILTLRELRLGCLQVDDAALESLGRMKQLEKIELLYLNRITDAGLLKLKGLTSLRSLEFYDCTGLTKDGVKALQAALPGKFVLE